jgi:hypothetical protein
MGAMIEGLADWRGWFFRLLLPLLLAGAIGAGPALADALDQVLAEAAADL